MKINNVMYQVFNWGWPVSWLLAIWSPLYRVELIWTGLFCLLFGCLLGIEIKMKKEGRIK